MTNDAWDDGISNARVTSTTLGYEDHGILCYWLHLDYGGVQTDGRNHSEVAGLSLEKILKVCGVSSWEKLPGTYLRVTKVNGLIKAITHVLDDRIRFEPELDFKPYLKEKEKA